MKVSYYPGCSLHSTGLEYGESTADVCQKLDIELDELKDSLKARLYDEKLGLIEEIKVRDVIKALGGRSDVRTIIFDGIITQRLVDLANNKGVKTIVGGKLGNVNKKPETLEIVTREK